MRWPTPLSSSAGVAARYVRNEYFLLNVAILVTYYFFRMEHTDDRVDIMVPFQYRDGKVYKSKFSTLHTGTFASIEAQVGASLVLTALARSYRQTSADALLATILGNCQVFVLVNTALTDRVAAVWYLLAFGLVFLLFDEPVYKGPSKVEALTAQLFMEQCLKDKGDGVAYAVMFQTSWSSRCRHAYPMFAELSLRYATDKLRFARVDVGTWPRLARSLNLDLSATSSQLPTVAIFEKGEEAGRIPSGTKASLSGSGKWTFSKVQLIAALQLDSRYARSMGTAAASTAAPGPAT